jgi:hypothetical protein
MSIENKIIVLFIFQEDYANSKGQMRGKLIHVDRDVQKSVQGDGKRNEHNYIAGGTISTKTCIKGMYVNVSGSIRHVFLHRSMCLDVWKSSKTFYS